MGWFLVDFKPPALYSGPLRSFSFNFADERDGMSNGPGGLGLPKLPGSILVAGDCQFPERENTPKPLEI